MKICGKCQNFKTQFPEGCKLGKIGIRSHSTADKYCFKPIPQLTEKEFYEKHYMMCGTQRCEGIGTEWFEGCGYRFELKNYTGE